jgi:hypothetical protein
MVGSASCRSPDLSQSADILHRHSHEMLRTHNQRPFLALPSDLALPPPLSPDCLASSSNGRFEPFGVLPSGGGEIRVGLIGVFDKTLAGLKVSALFYFERHRTYTGKVDGTR